MCALALERLRDPAIIDKRNASIRMAHAKESVKRKVSDASKKIWEKRSAEDLRDFSKKVSAGLYKYWSGLSESDKAARLSKWLAAGHAASADLTISSIERGVSKRLVDLSIEFTPQYDIGKNRVDFFVPSLSLIIECDGTYWHNLPGIPEKDAERDADHARMGMVTVRLTENEIKSDVVSAVDRALQSGLGNLP